MSSPRPLVWLPFDVSLLGDPPDSLRYEVFDLDSGEEVPDWVSDVELYVPSYRFAPADGEVIARMPRLRAVQTMSAGVEHIAPYVPEGVVLCNGRGIHNASTAELAVGLVIASLRGFPDFVRAQDRGEWAPVRARSLADRTVLIVGYGDIGRALEERLDGFEVEILRVARNAREGVHGFGELAEVLPRADVVVLVLPLTQETRGMVDARFLGLMREGALLVNIARGQIVDTGALVAALNAGRISAALDVTDPEPLPDDHPLWSAPNVLISPHVGGATSAMWPRAYRLVRDQLTRFADGERLENVMSGEY